MLPWEGHDSSLFVRRVLGFPVKELCLSWDRGQSSVSHAVPAAYVCVYIGRWVIRHLVLHSTLRRPSGRSLVFHALSFLKGRVLLLVSRSFRASFTLFLVSNPGVGVISYLFKVVGFLHCVLRGSSC